MLYTSPEISGETPEARTIRISERDALRAARQAIVDAEVSVIEITGDDIVSGSIEKRVPSNPSSGSKHRSP
jgi:hypothetical protein